MRYRVSFNGRFFAGPPTGVHRVAEELLHAIDALLASESGLARRYEFEVLLPPDATCCPLLRCVAVRACGRTRGWLWEQHDLPRHAAGALVVSLCNLGPVATRSAVTMIHDAQVHSTPRSYAPAFRAWYKLVQPIVGRRHRAVLTVSEFSRAELVRYGVAPAPRIRVIHNGADHLDRVEACTAARTRHGLRPGAYVLALATVQVHKNIGVLLEAFGSARSRDLQLALYGDATRRDFVSAGHVVPESVRFLGRVSDEDLKGLLRGARCLAFPSLTEGFGLPPLEAMRVGCPAVVAPRGAMPEVCSDGALYVDPADPAQWTAAFEALGPGASLRERTIAAGFANAGRFAWERAARSALDTLDEVADERCADD